LGFIYKQKVESAGNILKLNSHSNFDAIKQTRKAFMKLFYCSALYVF